jgi:glycosyltransferase involved in cell wall biosynthesis
LVISDVYFPRVNGVSTSIRSFNRDLALLGVTSTLVAPDYPQYKIASEPGVIRVPARPVPFDPEDCVMVWRTLKQTLGAIPHADYNLIHIQTPFLAHYAGLGLARARGLPVVATCHTYFEDYLHHYLPVLPGFAGAWLARSFMTRQLNATNAVVSPSEQIKVRLLEYGVTAPIEVIPTGMTEDRFAPGDGARFRANHGIETGRPLLLNVGRIAHEKNLDFLLRMFARVIKVRAEALLVIAGEGPARRSLERQGASLGLSGALRFIGNLDREHELNNCYAAANAFVFASRTETQGLVLLEAMAQSRPIVSTACLGTRSVLVPPSGAFVVEEKEAEFATAVIDVLSDTTLAAAMGERGKQWALSWSSRVQAQRMADLYRQVLTSHR